MKSNIMESATRNYKVTLKGNSQQYKIVQCFLAIKIT